MARNHLAHIARVTHFFKHFAEPLVVTTAGSGRKAEQVSRNAPLKNAEVIEYAPVTGCDGVVRFIDDDDRKLFRLEPRQASSIPSQRRYGGDDYFRVSACRCVSLFNLRFQFGIDQSKLIARLQQQLLPMREHEQTFLHIESIW